MYYIICTIVIMVFCITALTNKNAYEGEFLSRGPRSPWPQPQKCATERHIERANEFQLDGSSLLHAANEKKDACIKTATIQVNHHPHSKPLSSPVFLLTIIVPVTPFFLTNCKNEPTRRINTSANECYSLRQLRYSIAQTPINNGTTYRKVLRLKFDQEKSYTLKKTTTKYLAGRLFIYAIRFS